MKVKDFIFKTPYNVEGLKPIRESINEYGCTIRYYLINKYNLEILLLNRYDKDFKVRNEEDIKWFLNTNSVAIVNKVHLLTKFILRDELNRLESNVNVVV